MTDKLAYSIKEAAHELGVSQSLLKQELRHGRIKSVQIGARVLIPRWALEERLSPGVAMLEEMFPVEAEAAR